MGLVTNSVGAQGAAAGLCCLPAAAAVFAVTALTINPILERAMPLEAYNINVREFVRLCSLQISFEDAQEITSLLMPTVQDNSAEVQESLLKEVSNILSCSYMNALGELLGLLILPSVPGMIVDMVGAVLSSVVIEFGCEKDYIFCVETEFDFGELDRPLSTFFLLLPDTASLELILKKLNLAK